MPKIIACYLANDAAAMYYVMTAREVWEAWDWNDMRHGPKTMTDPNFRWRLIGQRVRKSNKLPRT